MRRSHGIGAQLTRTFLLQAAFISAAAVVGVFIAGALLEGFLVRAALREEASHYWARRAAQADFPLPDTKNLKGYLDDAPVELRGMGPGFHDWRSHGAGFVVYVEDRDRRRLYLAFDRSGVNRLATYYGLAPLAIVLLMVYASTWLGYRASKRALSPVIALARAVRRLDLRAPDPSAFAPERVGGAKDDEVEELAAALARLAEQLNDFIERERWFTRDASHELRSPLTVLFASAEMLANDPRLDEAGRRAVARIQRAARDMEELTGAFLLLARETEAGLPSEAVSVNEVLRGEMERARALAEGRPVEFHFDEHSSLVVEAPERVVAVLLGNLLRNAAAYTERGSVRVSIAGSEVIIEDTGVGIPEQRLREMHRPFVRGEGRRPGYGIGLTIVRRLSDRFGWPIAFDSQRGRGTRVCVSFGRAAIVPGAGR